MMKIIGNGRINVTARDVKEMWKACSRAKEADAPARAKYVATVRKAVEKATGKTVGDGEASRIAKEMEPSLQEYGKALKGRAEDIIGISARVFFGILSLAGVAVCFIAGKELLDKGDGLRAVVAWFVGVPVGGYLGISNIMGPLTDLGDGAKRIAEAARNVARQVGEAARGLGL